MNIRGRCAVLGLVAAGAAGSGQFNGLLSKVKQSTHGSNASLGSNLPASDIAAGLKKALAKGAANAINSLGHNGGFWNNAKVRIPLPGKLEQAARTARKLGQGGSPPDLDNDVSSRTIDGLFTEIGAEEQSTRGNPGARSTDLLKKIFGGH